MHTITAETSTTNWKQSMEGAELWAVDCFAAGDTDSGRGALVARARYRDEQMTIAEVLAAMGRTK